VKKLSPKTLLLVVIVPIVVILDQITKLLAVSALKPITMELRPEDRFISVIDGFFRLKYAENTGAAWSIFRDLSSSFRVPFFIVITLVAIGFIVWFFRRLEPRQRLMGSAISLVLGGAVGNLIDRIRLTYVVDFIDWFVTFTTSWNLGLFTIEPGEKHWPTFNVADAAITVGVILLMIELLFTRSAKPAPAGDGASGAPPSEPAKKG
jgi:signal peptidase II